jgi:cob(I)alamin adenosyltransferase
MKEITRELVEALEDAVDQMEADAKDAFGFIGRRDPRRDATIACARVVLAKAEGRRT